MAGRRLQSWRVGMAYQFFDHTGDIGVSLRDGRVDELFASAAVAFTDSITPLDGSRAATARGGGARRRPKLDLLLVDFLSELLYRFDTRGWLTREARSRRARATTAAGRCRGRCVGERLDDGAASGQDPDQGRDLSRTARRRSATASGRRTSCSTFRAGRLRVRVGSGQRHGSGAAIRASVGRS